MKTQRATLARRPFANLTCYAAIAVGAYGCGAVLGLDDLSVGAATGAGGNAAAGGAGGCTQVCNDLFDCAMVECAGGWTEGDRTSYLDGCNGDDGCVAACEPAYAQMAAVVNPADCATTVQTIGSFDSAFQDSCDNGLGGCGGDGAGGSSGGSGGAGGSAGGGGGAAAGGGG